MWHAAIIFASIAAQGDNLLLNPGFELLDGDMPARWHVFVMPQKGAEAGLDNAVSHAGKVSVRLHTSEPYEHEPMNNWSQNILRDLAGAELTLRGFVKTRQASQAELFLQCFRGDPYTLITAKSTNDEFPIFGDTDWTRVEVRLKVPPETRYVVVRCVLKGRGTAWFDDLELTRADEELPKLSDPADRPSLPAPKAPAPEKISGTAALPSLENSKQLLTANEELRKSTAEMRRMNEMLSLQVKQLQVEIQMLRNSMMHSQQFGDDELSALRLPAPPLVPHGFDPAQAR
jgi:hypothetical protein